MTQKMSGRRLLAVSLLLLSVLVSCVPPKGIEKSIAPFSKDTITAHFEALFKKIDMRFQPPRVEQVPADEEVRLVLEYFTLSSEARRLGRELRTPKSLSDDTYRILNDQLLWADRRRDLLKNQVEDIIARQVGQALSEAGLAVQLGPQGPYWFFPPAQFFLTKPPFVMVTSPRDRIEINSSYLLSAELSTDTINAIEEQTEAEAGESALIERTGGFSLYPAWVSEDDSLSHTLDTVAHEWTHAYLFMFTNLGRAYFRDYQMRTINETIADTVGHEIGHTVYNRYYKGVDSQTISSAAARQATDFAAQMRQIRNAVDQLLGQGRVEEAEAFMAAQRQQLEARGFYVRKLNQAYFALHGSYADATGFELPIGTDIKKLRARSSNLGDFMRLVGPIAGYSDFQRLIQ